MQPVILLLMTQHNLDDIIRPRITPLIVLNTTLYQKE